MIAKVFFDADLRYGIDGMREFLKKKKVATTTMREVDFILFLNRAKTQCKMVSFNERGAYLTTFKSFRGKMNIEDLKKIPKLYTDQSFKNGTMLEQVKEFFGKGVTVYTEGAELKAV